MTGKLKAAILLFLMAVVLAASFIAYRHKMANTREALLEKAEQQAAEGSYAEAVRLIDKALSSEEDGSSSEETLRLKNAEYIDAARTIGVSGPVMLLRHILPNCLPTLIVLFTLNVPTAILTESSLSFLGLGIQAPDASWGLMVNAGKNFLFNAPWLSVIPGLTIMVAVLAFNFLGDGLRDALDPHLKDR